jgi:hypothetical protein
LTYEIEIGGEATDTTTKPYGTLKVTFTDALAPSVTAPACRFVAGVTADTAGVKATCTWAGTPHGSPISGYALELSTDGSPFAPLAPAAKASVAYSFASGHQYRLRVRASDAGGRQSAWAASAVFTATAYEESKAAFKGKWTAASSAAYHGGGDKYAKAAGASATFTFTGRSVAWVAQRCKTCGKAKVYVNGAYLTTIDLRASATAYRRIDWARTWTTSAKRTVKIVVSGTAGRPRVDVDAFLVLK